MCLPENPESQKGLPVSKRWSKATLGTTPDENAHTWTESVHDSVHGTERGVGPSPDGGEGFRVVAGHASRGSFGSVCVRFDLPSRSARNSFGFAAAGLCECCWPLLHVCFGAQLQHRARPRGLAGWGVSCCAAARRLHSRSNR